MECIEVTDDQLAEYLRARDVALRDHIVACYWRFAMMVANRVYRERESDHDAITSEASLALVKAVESWTGELNGKPIRIATWIGSCVTFAARSCAHRQRRRRKRHEQFLENVRCVPPAADPRAQPWYMAAHRDEVQAVAKRLSEGERTFLALRFAHGRTFEQIAKLAGGMSVRVVKACWRHLLRKLRTMAGVNNRGQLLAAPSMNDLIALTP